MRAGSSMTTSAAVVRVSSRVRPSRERSPNSITVANASRSPISFQVARVAGAVPGQQPVHARLVVQVRRHDRGECLRVVHGVQHVADQVVQPQRPAERGQFVRQQRAQRELVGGVRHVAGPVRGVLRRVVEQQRLALFGSQRDLARRR